jgi:hypothetical protein
VQPDPAFRTGRAETAAAIDSTPVLAAIAALRAVTPLPSRITNLPQSAAQITIVILMMNVICMQRGGATACGGVG